MEEDRQAGSVEVPIKSLDTKVHSDEGEILTNGNLNQQIVEAKKEEDDETALEKEFIKVEKESIDVKDNSVSFKTISAVEVCSPEVKSSISEPNSELTEAQEKIKQLEFELGTLAQELQSAESEKAHFQAEVSVANEKLQQSNKQCEELEIDMKRLKEEMVEADLKHQSKLESLQEAFGAQEAKHKELAHVKEAFDGLSLEIESSRKNVEKLEQDLLLSTDKLRKFEVLSNERGLLADSQSKKALELEKLLEVANLSVKEMETQLSLVQEELRSLHDKVAQSQQAEEELNKTRLELSAVLHSLELSKLQAAELEQMVVSKEGSIQELTQELSLHKDSGEQLREDIITTKTLLSDSKEALQTKDVHLKEIELKLQEELNKRETIEGNLKVQELQVQSLQEELIRSSKEKEALELTIGELNGNLLQFKERCTDLDNKLNLSDENFSKTDSLLSETLAHEKELVLKIISLEELLRKYSAEIEMLDQKNGMLEDMVKASNYQLEEVKSQLRETETNLKSKEERNADLEQQLNLAELKFSDSNREINELRDKASELANLLNASEEEHAISQCHFQGYQERMSQLESSLEKSSLRKAELERELKELLEKCAEHESQSSVAQARSLELEQLIKVAHSKAENSGNRVGELEHHMETRNYRVLELEGQLSTSELKLKDIEAELKQKSSQLSELSAELEAFQVKSSSLEKAIEGANSKEIELIDLLNAVTEEKKKFEDLYKISSEKLSEAENHIDILQVELNSAKEKLQSVMKDLDASAVREGEILEKLKSTEEQLEHQGRTVEKATSRSLELEALHESLSKDSELKLQEANMHFTQKDSEIEELYEKLKSLEEQAASYQGQEAEATESLTMLKAELEKSSNRVVSLENIIEELQRELLDTEKRCQQSLSEKELHAESNTKLKEELGVHQGKINELHDILSSVHSEKDATVEQLAFHKKTITELRDQHSKVLELQSESESRKKETEGQLKEAFDRLTQRDSEAEVLNDKLNGLESQVKSYEEQLREAASAKEVQTVKLDESLSKLMNLEGIIEEAKNKSSQLECANESLAEANVKLTQELAAYEAKMNDLQTALNTIIQEKEQTFGELHLLRKTNDDLVHELASESERLQSQISSLIEEKNLINQMYQETRKEIQAVLHQMEEQLKEHQAKEQSLNVNLETLTSELKVKSELQAQVAELKHTLLLTETRFREEMEGIRASSTEKEAALTSKLEEHTSQLKEKDVLYEQLEQFQRELNLAHTTITEQRDTDARKDLDREAAIKQAIGDVEVKHQYVLVLEKQVEELKQKLDQSEQQYMEKREENLRKDLEQEAAIKQSLSEVEAKQQHVIVLEKQVEELKQKLLQSEQEYTEKNNEENKRLALLSSELDDLRAKLSQTAELEKTIVDLENKLQLAHDKANQYMAGSSEIVGKDGMEVKSRDIGSGSTPSKRKSKKRSEGSHLSSEGTSANPATTTTTEPTGAMALKFILGVALVSVIIGIYLGKRY